MEKTFMLRVLYDVVLAESESFEKQNIGSDLAYLMGAILNGSTCSWPADRPFVKLLKMREHLPAVAHALRYIGIEPAPGYDSTPRCPLCEKRSSKQ